MEKKVSLTHKITDEIAIKIKEIINGNYQQAALGTIDDTGFPMAVSYTHLTLPTKRIV